jgi:hypothetical protein
MASSTSVLLSVIPRSASTISRVRNLPNAIMVALMRFFGLLLPKHLVKQSCTPIMSKMDRTEAPAITPVPGAAGTRRTLLAP